MVHQTVRGEIDLKNVIGIQAYSTGPMTRPGDPLVAHVHDEHCDHAHDDSSTHYTIRGISSLQVSCPPLPPDRLPLLDEWLRSVLWDSMIPSRTTPDLEVLRCKGLIETTNGKKWVLQGVRAMYDFNEVAGEELGAGGEGKIVFIGKGLGDAVRASLLRVLREVSLKFSWYRA